MEKTKLKDSRTARKYSKSFKIKVLRELEFGRLYNPEPGELSEI